MGQALNINEINNLYPDEWVLVGNPTMDNKRIDVLSGVPIYHSKDKKEVCYMGRDKTSSYEKIALIFTGSFRPTRKITGIFNRIKQWFFLLKGNRKVDSLWWVSIEVDHKFELKMVLDTGASNTTIDSNSLYLLGYDLKDSIGKVEIETANGIIETEVFEIDSFAALWLTKDQFQIQVYDFMAHGIFSDYNGLLGLDFLEGTKFCIDLNHHTITLT